MQLLDICSYSIDSRKNVPDRQLWTTHEDLRIAIVP